MAELSGLSDHQWAIPSLCAGWDVHDVLEHLLDTAKTGRWRFVRGMIAARLDFDRANQDGLVRERQADPRDTLAAFAAASDLKRTPPANLATRLVEAIVHGEDIRRPLQIGPGYPDFAVAQALGYQIRTSMAMGGARERVSGLRLVATDMHATWPAGPDPQTEVRGCALDLLLAASGRPVSADRLSGRGVHQLIASGAPTEKPADENTSPVARGPWPVALSRSPTCPHPTAQLTGEGVGDHAQHRPGAGPP